MTTIQAQTKLVTDLVNEYELLNNEYESLKNTLEKDTYNKTRILAGFENLLLKIRNSGQNISASNHRNILSNTANKIADIIEKLSNYYPSSRLDLYIQPLPQIDNNPNQGATNVNNDSFKETKVNRWILILITIIILIGFCITIYQLNTIIPISPTPTIIAYDTITPSPLPDITATSITKITMTPIHLKETVIVTVTVPIFITVETTNTPTPTKEITSTSIPTPTIILTPSINITETVIPTITLTPGINITGTITPTITTTVSLPTATPIFISTPIYYSPSLSKPGGKTSADAQRDILTGKTLVTFEWSWDGNLASNQAFEIYVWKDGQDKLGAYDACETMNDRKYLGNSKYSLTFDVKTAAGVGESPSGEYFWTVGIVNIACSENKRGTYKRLGLEAEKFRIAW